MSRRKRKVPKPASQISKPKQVPRISTGLIIAVLLTAILAGIPFGIGKYIELNSPGPFDSGAFVYSAQHLLQGAKLGVDEFSSARPGTLLANIIGVKMFGFNDTGPKIVQMLLQLAAFIFMFITLRKIFGSVAAVIGTTIAAVYLSAPLIAKLGNVKEQFMIPFMIAAACCFLLYGYSQKSFWMILSGFFAVQPYYFKPTGLSIVVALLIVNATGNALAKKWKPLVLESVFFLTGYIAGLLLPGSLYLWQDTPAKLLGTLPVLLLEVGFAFGLLAAGIIITVVFIRKIHLVKKLRCVSKKIWISGLCLILIVLIGAIIMIKNVPGSENSDIISYIQDIPLIQLPGQLFGIIDSKIDKLLSSSALSGGYVSDSWKNISFPNLASRIFRYYKALCVPILLALGSILTAVCVWLLKIRKKNTPSDIHLKYAWVLAMWWILDMMLVWGSPRSYEQYYLPLCASAAMLSSYVVWKWHQQFTTSTNKIPWLAGGLVAVIALGSMTVPIFIGQRYSPDRGKALDYIKVYGQRRRGFGPSLKELPSRKKGAWVAVGDYIRTHSEQDDTIYVWGWFPGIYVQAQRLAPVSKAFEGNMHVTPPEILKLHINSMIDRMKKNPPKFIVDSRKEHFPNDRPPLELWPIVRPNILGNKKQRLLKNEPQEIAVYDALWKRILETQIEPAEGQRYDAMKPFRELVMNNYRVVKLYGRHVLFERK